MKIKWVVDAKWNPIYGRMEFNHEYTVDATFGKQIIRQKFAVEVKEPTKMVVKKSENKKGGK